jgi:hypothetical protein
MTKELYGLCQSGQAVKVAGIYKLVGVVQRTMPPNDQRTTHTTLHAGEFFPDYEGRAVCWYLMEPIAAEHVTPPSIGAARHNRTEIN